MMLLCQPMHNQIKDKIVYFLYVFVETVPGISRHENFQEKAGSSCYFWSKFMHFPSILGCFRSSDKISFFSIQIRSHACNSHGTTLINCVPIRE